MDRNKLIAIQLFSIAIVCLIMAFCLGYFVGFDASIKQCEEYIDENCVSLIPSSSFLELPEFSPSQPAPQP